MPRRQQRTRYSQASGDVWWGGGGSERVGVEGRSGRFPPLPTITTPSSLPHRQPEGCDRWNGAKSETAKRTAFPPVNGLRDMALAGAVPLHSGGQEIISRGGRGK